MYLPRTLKHTQSWKYFTEACRSLVILQRRRDQKKRDRKKEENLDLRRRSGKKEKIDLGRLERSRYERVDLEEGKSLDEKLGWRRQDKEVRNLDEKVREYGWRSKR